MKHTLNEAIKILRNAGYIVEAADSERRYGKSDVAEVTKMLIDAAGITDDDDPKLKDVAYYNASFRLGVIDDYETLMERGLSSIKNFKRRMANGLDLTEIVEMDSALCNEHPQHPAKWIEKAQAEIEARHRKFPSSDPSYRGEHGRWTTD